MCLLDCFYIYCYGNERDMIDIVIKCYFLVVFLLVVLIKIFDKFDWKGDFGERF